MPPISFANPKGGAGKTTSALLLATELAGRGAEVVVIDADPERWISQWGALPGRPGRISITALPLPGDLIRPFVYLYLLVLAVLILVRASGRMVPRREVRRVPVLGFFAGLLDASGGGGWGPLATSTLLAGGGQARTVIGSVNAAEFVVTLAVSITFFLSIGIEHLQIVLGLLVGGMIAAPVAALLVRRVREKWVLVAVGLLVLCISLYQIGHALARLL